MDTKRKLLLVDDDPSLLETLGDFLTFEGYTVECAASGEEALVKMRPFQPDLVILDMSMPGMGGKGFLERVTNPDGTTLYPILVLTARSTMAEYFADKNIAGFIAKPCDPGDLHAEISRILFETANDGAHTAPPASLRRLVLAEGDPVFRERLRAELSRAGFDVTPAQNGGEAVEQCVLVEPDALVIRLETPGMSADEVIATLRRLPRSKGLKAVVYGLDLPEAQLSHVANLDLPDRCLLKDLAVDALIDRVMALTGGD